MITAAYARELFSYCPERGILIWAVKTCRKICVGDVAGCEGGDGYLLVGADGRQYLVHRLIWLMVHGVWPDQIDHINGIRHDNRLENLRAVTSQENRKNQKRRSTNTSGVVGVSWDNARNKWQAKIAVNHKDINLGRFVDFFEAVCRRKSAEVRYGFHPNHGRCS